MPLWPPATQCGVMKVVMTAGDETGTVGRGGAGGWRDRTLTLMFTDLAASTALTSRRGDADARRLIADHRRIVRKLVEDDLGQEVDTAGDGLFATFGSARSSLRCALRIRSEIASALSSQLAIRIGIHSGDVLHLGRDVSGNAVNAAARIAALAEPNQILASEVVKLLVGTSPDLSLEPVGLHTLKGLPDRWRLFAVEPRNMISIAIAEDNVLVREGIGNLIRSMDNVRLVAACHDLPTLLESVETLAPDVVITDVRMPPTGTDEGYEIARILRARHPRIGVVVLSQHADLPRAQELLEGPGGRAFLLKESVASQDVVSRAIEVVAGGGKLMDPSLPSFG